MKHFTLAVAVLALLTVAQAHADTITLTSALAGYITSDPAGVLEGPYGPDIFGTAVGSIDHWQSGSPFLPVAVRAVYEFDLGALDPSRVTGATLAFTPTDIASFGFTCFDLGGCPPLALVDVLGYIGDGLVERDDYHSGAVFVGRTTPTFGAPISVNATNSVRGAGSGFAGFTINPGSENGIIGVQGVALQIEYNAAPIPEPASIGIVAGGLVILAAALRRGTRRRR